MIALIILFFVVIINFIIIGICFSNIVVDIENLNCNSKNIKQVLTEDIEFYIKIYIFKVLRILTIKVYNTHLEILGIKINFNKLIYDIEDTGILFRKVKKIIRLIKDNKENINFENLKPKIKEFKMDLEISTENAILTSISILSISSTLSLLLKKYIEKYEKEKYYYRVTPKFTNTNDFSINLNFEMSFETLKILVFAYEIRELFVQNKIENKIKEQNILENSLQKLKILRRLGRIDQKRIIEKNVGNNIEN